MLRSVTRRRGLALAAAVLAALTAAVVASAATHRTGRHAAPAARTRLAALPCGFVVTSSVTLSDDIGGCNGNGLTVTGSNLVVNLNGHRILGVAGVFGVEVDGSNVTIENGRITGFATGVDAVGTGAKLVGLRIRGNQNGALLAGNLDSIAGSTVFRNTSDGVNVGFVTGAKVTNDNVRGNTLIGISSLGQSITISGNHVVGNGTHGISIQGDATALTSNVADGNGQDGIFVDDDLVTLTKNTAHFNTKLGIEASSGDTDGGGNKAADNGSLHQCTPVVCS